MKFKVIQVALCLVLCGHQHRCQMHVHWEQPKGSLMMKLPHVQEVNRYTPVAKPDMRDAGEMRDPVSMKVMRKGLVIATTSMAMHACLDPLTCIRDHEHQMIEGSTESQGLTIARSAFSEIYPRKFARLVAKQILKRCFPHDKPIGSIADPALLMLDQLAEKAEALASAERAAKLMKLSPTKGRIERPLLQPEHPVRPHPLKDSRLNPRITQIMTITLPINPKSQSTSE